MAALKDADYAYCPAPSQQFIQQYREAGGKATLVGNDIHAAFTGMLGEAGVWGLADGMLFVRSTRWWNEEGEIVDFTNELVRENHPDDWQTIVENGGGYLATCMSMCVMDMVRKAVDTVGVQAFDSEALYQAAQDSMLEIDGVPRYSLGPDKRYANDYYGIYEVNGADEDIYRIDPEWYYQVMSP